MAVTLLLLVLVLVLVLLRDDDDGIDVVALIPFPPSPIFVTEK
jgi:hypothetical protein